MKTRPNYIKAGILAAIVSFITISSTHAAVSVIWSGGNGTPLSCTFSQPALFTISANPVEPGMAFVMPGVGNLLNNRASSVTGNLTFTIDGGVSLPITNIASGFSGGAVTSNDTLFGTYATYALGDTIVLNPGTLTTSGNVTAAPPVNGPVDMYIADSNGNNVSAPVPEVSSTLLCGLGALGLLRRRR